METNLNYFEDSNYKQALPTDTQQTTLKTSIPGKHFQLKGENKN